MFQKKQNFIKIIVITCLLAMPMLASAAGLVPCGGDNEKPCTVYDAFFGIGRVTNWLIMVAGVFAVYQIVNAGFWLIVTMGNEENITKYKKGISSAVIGFVLVMMAYLLVNTAVNYILTLGNANYRVDLTNPFGYIKK